MRSRGQASRGLVRIANGVGDPLDKTNKAARRRSVAVSEVRTKLVNLLAVSSVCVCVWILQELVLINDIPSPRQGIAVARRICLKY